MRPSPLAALAVGLAAFSVTLTGCATGAGASVETPAAVPSSEPSATPTPEPISLGPAELPPLEFDGDCQHALAAEDLAGIVGTGVTPDPEGDRYLANMGALECTWTGADIGAVRLYVMPRSAIDGPVLPAREESAFFDECSYDGSTCAWQGGDESVWIAAEFVAPHAVQEEVNAWGAAIAARVLENRSAHPAEPWTRDRTGWWFALDCAQAATAIGAQLGRPVEGMSYGWDADRPPVGYAVGLTTAGHTQCLLSDAESGQLWRTMRVYPGEGGRAVDDGYVTVDFGVPGITVYADATDREDGRSTYVLTDGVNRIELSVSGDSAEQFAVAVAAAAASDFE